MKSKIIFFSVVVFIGLINLSCGKKFAENLRDDHIIPYTPVYTEIDLGIGGESNLQIPGQPLYQTLARPDGNPLGYQKHGIVIFRVNDTEYKCWDATCTNCEDLTSYFTQSDLSGAIATCPVCEMSFSLEYGTPFNTEKKIYPLKEYFITKRGNKLIVSY